MPFAATLKVFPLSEIILFGIPLLESRETFKTLNKTISSEIRNTVQMDCSCDAARKQANPNLF